MAMATTEQQSQEAPVVADNTFDHHAPAIVNGGEPVKVVPSFAQSFGLVIVSIFFLAAGWYSGDGRSIYNADISGIVAHKIRLPDGRHIAYEEKGVSRDVAKRNIMVLHGFLSCRLAGLPGVSERLLEKYEARVVAYDRPGIGQSDPHHEQNFNTSAQDMADIADALGMGDKFWVLGYSGGGPYAWAALRYIPHRLSGVAFFGPMGNPFAKNMTQEESNRTWKETDRGRRIMFRLAHYTPSLLPGFIRSGVIGKPVTISRGVIKAASPKDLALLETHYFGEGFERQMRESMRSGDARPHAEGVILHCRDWGFELSDLRPKPVQRSLLKRMLFSLGSSDSAEFSGPIHIFHGTEDTLVPLAMSQYAKRMLPELHLHILEGHGHFSWFCYCDSCHREFFKTLFGEVAGLDELDKAPDLEPTPTVKATSISEVAPLQEPDVAVTEMLAAVSSEADGIALEERNVDVSDDAVEISDKEHEL